MLIGRSLGLPEPDMLDVGVGALMHDVGKQDIAERYHHADEHCSPSEAAAYRDHVARGVAHGRRMALSAERWPCWPSTTSTPTAAASRGRSPPTR